MSTTRDLTDFGHRERLKLIEILQAWENNGLPDDYSLSGVVPEMNQSTGNVYLINYEGVKTRAYKGKLEIWYECVTCAHEGFKEDCQLNDEGCNECCPKEAS